MITTKMPQNQPPSHSVEQQKPQNTKIKIHWQDNMPNQLHHPATAAVQLEMKTEILCAAHIVGQCHETDRNNSGLRKLGCRERKLSANVDRGECTRDAV
jgi:hypothetical protein